jgi:hypothetical protein
MYSERPAYGGHDRLHRVDYPLGNPRALDQLGHGGVRDPSGSPRHPPRHGAVALSARKRNPKPLAGCKNSKRAWVGSKIAGKTAPLLRQGPVINHKLIHRPFLFYVVSYADFIINIALSGLKRNPGTGGRDGNITRRRIFFQQRLNCAKTICF